MKTQLLRHVPVKAGDQPTGGSPLASTARWLARGRKQRQPCPLAVVVLLVVVGALLAGVCGLRDTPRPAAAQADPADLAQQ